MGAIVIPPSWSQDFGNSIANLAEGVANTVNPFHQLQVSARQQIVKDPALAQHLSDLEDQSPGTLDALGLGKLGKVIAKIPPSEAQTLQKQQQQAMQANQPNADTQAAMASKSQTGQLPEQRALTSGEATIEQQRGQLAGPFLDYVQQHPELGPIAGALGLIGRSPGNLVQEAAQSKAFSDLQNRFPDTENMDMMQTAHDWVTGKPVDNQLIDAARINPATSGSWTEAEKYMTARETQKASMQRWFDTNDQRLSLEEMHETFGATMSLGLPLSSAEDVRSALFTPAGRAKLAQAQKDPTHADPAFVAINQATEQRGQSLTDKQLTPVQSKSYKALQMLTSDKTPAAEKTAAIEDYNSAERELNPQAPLQARFGSGLFSRNQVEFWQTTPDGQSVKMSPDNAWQSLTSSLFSGPTTGGSQAKPAAQPQANGGLSPYAANLVSQLSNIKGLNKANLDATLSAHGKFLGPADKALIEHHFGFPPG